jgi:exosortase A-associated hydrolase 2
MTPFYLHGSQGELFAIYHAPVVAGSVRGQILVVPPFAEEMNKSRRMLTLQAQALAGAGYGTLIVDLYGTGDSAGDFSEARWDIWKSDLDVAVNWLLQEQVKAKISLLGVRLGALLAMDFCRGTNCTIDRVVLWQPQLNGKAAMTQFFRLRSAGSAIRSAADRESTSSLRALLQNGATIEVAGYELAPELVTSIDALNAGNPEPYSATTTHWFEVMSGERPRLSAVGRHVVDLWRRQGVVVTDAVVPGPPFWSTAEITIAPALLSATVTAFNASI